jgi:hypothetical protein
MNSMTGCKTTIYTDNFENWAEPICLDNNTKALGRKGIIKLPTKYFLLHNEKGNFSCK